MDSSNGGSRESGMSRVSDLRILLSYWLKVVIRHIGRGTAASDVTILVLVTISPNVFTSVKVGRQGAEVLTSSWGW